MSTCNFMSFEVILGYESNLFSSALHVLWKKVSAGDETHFLTGEEKPEVIGGGTKYPGSEPLS